VINIFRFIIFIFLFTISCSFNDVGGFWSKEENLKNENLNFKPLFKKDELTLKEFNQNFKFLLNQKELKINNNSANDNNDGFVIFDGKFEKIQKYNFSKIENFSQLESNLIFNNGDLIFFDNKGSILSFDKNSKLKWKINNYTRNEKKLSPLLSMTHKDNHLFISDNLSKIYSIDLNDGRIIWSKKNPLPFNSLIKLFDSKIFVVDTNNNLNCYSKKDGSLIWQHKTEKSFINSSKKLSILIKDNIVIFSNSLGDITAINVNNGSLIWQKFTQNSKIYEDIMTLKMSHLIINNDSIYFSSNKNKFYSIDFNTGTTNWIQEINSNVKPTVIGNFIFTISLDGYFFIIEKNTGNILRITNVFKKLKMKKNEKIYPTGFILNFKDLFISTNNGKIIIVDIKTGNIKNILKIDSNIISRPIVQDQNMYVIKDNSIIKLN
tara:strand:- start:106 stop:1410 length:1305 start_codon:yes stop_codon:yes gene_type:complete